MTKCDKIYKYSIRFCLLVGASTLISLMVASCDFQKGDLPHSVKVVKGDTNGVVVSRDNKKLNIYGSLHEVNYDCEKLLLTHYRRDLLWAAGTVIKKSKEILLPVREVDSFVKVDSCWSNFGTLQGGDSFKWQDLEFKVIDTPGFTRGAISYLCNIDGKKIAFTGDLIYGDGQLIDIYSLQDEIKELNIGGYHAFAGRMAVLIKSLRLIKNENPDIIIGSHGDIIYNPAEAIDKLINRLQRLYSNFLSTTAYRWYTGNEKQYLLAERMQLDSTLVDWMPLAQTMDESNIPWLIHEDNSVLITSHDGVSFLIDCASKNTFQKLLDIWGNNSLGGIEGIFVTHYHNDHTMLIPELVEKYNCPVYVTKELEDILVNPSNYSLMGLIGETINNIEVVPEEYKMKWHEFEFTFYNFPGQTIYHDAMLVENNGDKIFLIGDSFTPTGMDDYCLQNRNIIQDGKGYFYCIDVLRNMPDDVWLLNQHVHKLFQFSPTLLDFMEQKLKERETILAELSPWENINYLIDEQWARFYPYNIHVKQGEEQNFSLIIENYRNKACTYRIQPNVRSASLAVSPSYQEITIPAKTEGIVTFLLSAKKTGKQIITTDIMFNGKTLHDWCKGIVYVD